MRAKTETRNRKETLPGKLPLLAPFPQCTYTATHPPTYIPIYTHLYTYPHTSIYIHTHIHPYTPTYPYISIYTPFPHTHTHRALWGASPLSTHSDIHTHLTKLQALFLAAALWTPSGQALYPLLSDLGVLLRGRWEGSIKEGGRE